ncbi:hypothetical protein JIN85_18605 [Luteolibacter pohnpeiensis]|uniref:Uncharacterized protein n=1 Tax=Luteolibacter pohnpeiensis TaxID=454153 RepID=A0A934VYE0_9BACT|nr:hypothetical protein [Luteolibacter pohnpeiensis]MBK1884434.1 hypothetical protein [Luteolibacter pohnpeiensis]
MANPTIGNGVVVLPVNDYNAPLPSFYGVRSTTEVRAEKNVVVGKHRVEFKIFQGNPEILEIGLGGDGEIDKVEGAWINDWSVRTNADGARFLSIRPKELDLRQPNVISVESRTSVHDGRFKVLLPSSAGSSSFTGEVHLTAVDGVEVQLNQSDGLRPLSVSQGIGFIGDGAGLLDISVIDSGPDAGGAILKEVMLTGTCAPDGESVDFDLTGLIHSQKEGATVDVLTGNGAIANGVAGDGWHLELRRANVGYDHVLIAEREGDIPFRIEFQAPVEHDKEWSSLNFSVPGGVIIPIQIRGLDRLVVFDPKRAVVPKWSHDAAEFATGFLAANGSAELAWKQDTNIRKQALVFSSEAVTDIQVGSGLVKQKSNLNIKVLQGEMPGMTCQLFGKAEVMAVRGDGLRTWSVREQDGIRLIELEFSQPMKESIHLSMDLQTSMSGFPARVDGVRVVPVGALRHSGWLRLRNDGAVRSDVVDHKGLIQISADSFPMHDEVPAGLVYRFPSAEYQYVVAAHQVLPEVGVTEVSVYHLDETDRRIESQLELDIREASIRDWELEIPDGYSVAGLGGSSVQDYTLGENLKNGMRKLKILFNQPLFGRQLIALNLEKNDPAAAGDWLLQPLEFPDAKSRRGYIGATAAAGYRLAIGETSGGTEVPVTFFPRKIPALQQAFRLKEESWKLQLQVEALGQSVQADVFHLYSLKSGSAYGSVLMNFFVVGAPVSEWKIAVPESIGNIEVTGQSVGRDWRRQGTELIVPLSRPVSGAVTLLVTFEQPMSAAGGEISPGEVRPLGVQSERGYIQVVSPLQVDYEVARSEGSLLKLEATELPPEFRILSSAQTLEAWQYTSRDFQIGMQIHWYEQGETVEQVADFVKLSTHVSRDGEWVTNARYFIKSKGQTGLRMLLPDHAILWKCEVAGESVHARQDDGQILIPVEVKSDPNELIEVVVQYGAKSKNSDKIHLIAPILESPLVLGEWMVTADEGRVLNPKSGNAEQIGFSAAGTGWSWMRSRKLPVFTLISIFLLMWYFRDHRVGVVLGLIGAFGALVFGLIAAKIPQAGLQSLEYTTPVLNARDSIFVEIANVQPWKSEFSLPAISCLLLGAAIIGISLYKKWRIVKWIGILTFGMGVLSLHHGAMIIFLLIAILMAARCLPRTIAIIRPLLRKKASVISVWTLVFLSLSMLQARSEEHRPAESIQQEWRMEGGRVQAKLSITMRGEVGDRYLLLNQPAVVTSFDSNSSHLLKVGTAYLIELDSVGLSQASVNFEMAPGDSSDLWLVPTGPAVMQILQIRRPGAGWEFYSDQAAKITPLDGDAANQESGAVITLNPSDHIMIGMRPMARDVSKESLKFFVESQDLFVADAGVVTGQHHFDIKPTQGRLQTLSIHLPKNFAVADVDAGPIGSWAFDPSTQELNLVLEPFQDHPFGFNITTQCGIASLPSDLVLQPLRVKEAAGEVGLLGIVYGDGVQGDLMPQVGLTKVDPGDFRIGGNDRGRPQQVFRYSGEKAEGLLRLTNVEPDLRSDIWQVISLGEDRLVVSTDLTVDISKAGVFKLELSLPADLDIESVTGEGMDHWSESHDGEKRLLIIYLTEKSIGRRMFSLTMSGAAVPSTENWEVPKLSLRNTSRESGRIVIVPERGLQVRAVDRQKISQIDASELASGTQAKIGKQPGALAYRLLERDWILRLAIGKLDPWITAQVLQDVTLREGQVLSHLSMDYRIENSAVKSVRIRIPGLDEDAAATVRASGTAVADLVRVPDEPELWDVHFQRGIAGNTKVDLEFQRRGTADGVERISTVELMEVRQLTYFVALRAGGRLELSVSKTPSGWQKTDWSVLRAAVSQFTDQMAPALAFRVADADGPLEVAVARHQLAGTKKMRVSAGELTSLISPTGQALTAVDLTMQVVEIGTIRLTLPDGAKLFNVEVNGEGANLVRDANVLLFRVSPPADQQGAAKVRFTYSSSNKSELEGPLLDVPMENLTWRVLVPEGWKFETDGGDFDLKKQSRSGVFRLEDYQSFAVSKRSNDSESAVAMLDKASAWMRSGDQEKASAAFDNALKSNRLDEASNEDARIQLRQLRMQQAMLGLNTRRQKVLMDQNLEGGENVQIEQAAESNPLLRGAVNFDPKDFDRAISGNSADENAALKEIAARIVAQQLAAEPARQGLEVTIPEHGTVLTFGRSIQIAGDEPMKMKMKLEKKSQGGLWVGLAACVVFGLVGGTRFRHH